MPRVSVVCTGIFVAAALSSSVSRACISGQCESIHFHSEMPDFATPPRRGFVSFHGEQDDRPVQGNYGGGHRSAGVELSEERDRLHEDAWNARYQAGLKRADAEAEAGRWAHAAALYTHIAGAFGWTGELRDRWQLVSRLGGGGHRVAPFGRYLAALRPLDRGHPDQALPAFEQLAGDSREGPFAEHARYQIACCRADPLDGVRDLEAFLARYPRSPKRESALIMLARRALLRKDPDLAVGNRALGLLGSEFPHSRFRRSAVGLRARIDFVLGRWSRALPAYFELDDLASVEDILLRQPDADRGRTRVRLIASYLRRLPTVRSWQAYAFALGRLNHHRKSMSARDASALSAMLMRDVGLTAPYFYYRLYHCNPKRRDLVALASLADRLARVHPELRGSGGRAFPPIVLTRLSEVYYQRRMYGRALDWSERSVRAKVTDRALWARGAARHRLGQVRGATGDFRELLARFPNTPMERAAREELSILLEEAGDLAGALDQYFAIGSQWDVAWFLDARMTVPQVEAYLKRGDGLDRLYSLGSSDREWSRDTDLGKLTVRRRHLIVYALAVRYMRQERWNAAARLFRSVPRDLYRAFSKGRLTMEDKPSPDPLTAIREIDRLDRAARAARSGDGRAAALYALASYYYQHGLLLLYNPSLWQARRMDNFDFDWNTRHARRPDEDALRSHIFAHEVYAHTLAICRQIAADYPRSPSAPLALYRGACAARWLANLNETWRKENARRSNWAIAASMMRRMAARYPRHPLARHARKYAVVFRSEGQAWTP